MSTMTILDRLSRMREIKWAVWEGNRRDAEDFPEQSWRREYRDNSEMDVRTLDYLMTAILRAEEEGRPLA